ncbi:hypothetical protein ACFO3U_08830 [Flavobacterium ponti]|uniref:Metal-dependent HD superfamily phosphohydrolase n=1 Tax=Flavobacterium ponti TaxID=665133 RepID=A0ABV9P403_9FLAO
MELYQSFIDLLQRIGFNSTESQVRWQELEKAYTSKSRHYHNLRHLEEMITLYELHHSDLQFPDEVLYAIFYHDYVYKVTKKDNELKSAEYAIAILPEQTSLNKTLIFDMICATQLHQHQTNEDINWLIDFDLKILAKDWNDYEIYTQQIRKEYKI